MGHLCFISVPPTADTNRGYSGKECFSQSRESEVPGEPAQSPTHSRCSVNAGLTELSGLITPCGSLTQETKAWVCDQETA